MSDVRLCMSEDVPRLWHEVLEVPSTVTADELALYFKSGILPEGALATTYEEFEARGRLADCDCQLIQCVCAEARQHVEGCYYRKSITCAIPIECDEHGHSICLSCYPCTCSDVARNISMGIPTL